MPKEEDEASTSMTHCSTSSCSSGDAIIDKNEEKIKRYDIDDIVNAVVEILLISIRTSTMVRQGDEESTSIQKRKMRECDVTQNDTMVDENEEEAKQSVPTQRKQCGVTLNEVMVNENEKKIKRYDTNTNASSASSSSFGTSIDAKRRQRRKRRHSDAATTHMPHLRPLPPPISIQMPHRSTFSSSSSLMFGSTLTMSTIALFLRIIITTVTHDTIIRLYY
ncbi:hypothetical protein B296_00051599 [Ensete ventricosum]|uniref:Uncharacterized protein n=1 Tax=Ensete ventricosum TaxID=4639 RepID=A0A426XZQ0_ENSVE|nr:hypothetical protein B296_00051599 [Ensete ventricosum]